MQSGKTLKRGTRALKLSWTCLQVLSRQSPAQPTQGTSSSKQRPTVANTDHEGGPDTNAPYSSSPGPSAQIPQWALGGSKPGMVRMERKFKDLRADQESNMKLWHLRSRIGIPCNSGQRSSVPTLMQTSLWPTGRMTKGPGKSERWTTKDFEPMESKLAPLCLPAEKALTSSQDIMIW